MKILIALIAAASLGFGLFGGNAFVATDAAGADSTNPCPCGSDCACVACDCAGVGSEVNAACVCEGCDCGAACGCGSAAAPDAATNGCGHCATS